MHGMDEIVPWSTIVVQSIQSVHNNPVMYNDGSERATAFVMELLEFSYRIQLELQARLHHLGDGKR